MWTMNNNKELKLAFHVYFFHPSLPFPLAPAFVWKYEDLHFYSSQKSQCPLSISIKNQDS